jgi:SNF2 family DNA or RNA helicase
LTETQLSKKTLENHLQSLFTPQMRTRGLDLLGQGAVQEVFMDDQTGKVHGTVKGESAYYKQELVINEKNRFLSNTSCTCPVGKNCKHSAAVIHHMLNNDIDVVDPDNPNSGTLEKGSEIFRYFPKGEPANKLLEDYSYSNNSLTAHDKVIKLLSDNTIQMVCYEKQPYYLGGDMKEIADVLFDVKDETFGLKCNSCKTATHKLCKHQKLALEHLIYEVEVDNYISGRLNYDSQVELFSESMGISRSVFLDSYDLRLKLRRVELFKINDALFDAKDIELLDNRLSILSRPLNEKNIQKIEDQTDLGNALLWSPSFRSKRLFRLIKGRYNKSKDKLSAKLASADYPSYLKESQIISYNLLNGHQYAIDLKKLDSLASVRNNIIANLDEVNDILHYLDTTNQFPEISKSSIVPFKFSSDKLTIELTVSQHEIGYELNGEVKLNREKAVPSGNIVTTPLFCLIDNTAYLYEYIEESTVIAEFLKSPNLLFSKNDEVAFSSLLEKLSNKTNLKWNVNDKVEKIIKTGGNRTIYLSEVGQYIILEPFIEFNNSKFNILSEYEKLDKSQRIRIDQNERQEYIDILRTLHPNFNIKYFVQDYFFLKIDEVMDDLWFLNFYEDCRVNQIEVFGQENLTKLNFSPYRGKVTNYVKSGIDWFDVNVDMTFGDQVVSTMDWVKAIRDNQKYVKLGDGTLGLIPEAWIKKLKRIVQAAEVSKEGVQISKFKFNVIDELFDEIDDNQILLELKEKKQKLLDFDYRKQYDLPKEVTADLRPYQETGYQWLKTLDEIGWGGILADDMGLGKTVQVISLLTEVHKDSALPSLVVVPRSLIFNWCNELDKFSPELKYLIHYGTDRRVSQEKFNEYDVIITTYTLIANDIRDLSDVKFNYIILDESQAIKNTTSQRYRSVCLLRSNNKFCMTGTPIENNTFELFAQMNFVNPGMLGSQKSFKDLYANPIDANGDEEAARMLKKIINPFLLRRTKEVVAKDLPDKTETVIYCEMGKNQRRIYNEVKAQIREDLKGKVAKDGINKSKMKILEGLLRLRQICNSPVLVKDDLHPSQRESIKIDTLVEQLTDELNNHNALVFSQFTSMLDLIRKELDKKGIKYSYLDGSTRKRKEVVQEFDENDEIKIFLISLKAGNTGLNLVKADYVYIVDPWWNPAVEAQAIDRTHRIGQDKNIFAYKLVCKNTIEEKILKLQAKKKKIASDIISTDENIMKTLDKDELLGLFD